MFFLQNVFHILIVKGLRHGKGMISNSFSPIAPHLQPVQTVDMEKPTKILVVDDDPALRQLLAVYLNKHGMDTLLAPDATDLASRISRFGPDLVVLDRMMPGIDGAEACRGLRAQSEDIPVILLTAKDEPVDRIIGLEAGADDYLGKPFDPRELLARIEAVLRRKRRPFCSHYQLHLFISGNLCLILPPDNSTRGGEVVKLTGGEINLLEALVNNAGKPLSREKLLTLARDDDNGERNDRAIDIAVLRLRRAIEDDPKQPRWIQTVWGTGYRFSP